MEKPRAACGQRFSLAVRTRLGVGVLRCVCLRVLLKPARVPRLGSDVEWAKCGSEVQAATEAALILRGCQWEQAENRHFNWPFEAGRAREEAETGAGIGDPTDRCSEAVRATFH